MNCRHCKTETKTDRMPRGWHRDHTAAPVCKACWAQRYVLRAITIPVKGPVNGEWPELRESLKAAWADTTALSNFLITEYYARDIRRAPEMEKMPPMPKIYLYPEARVRFPDLASNSVVAVDHAISGKYRSKRYPILWTGSESLPSFRYPVPYPMHNAGWKAKVSDEVPTVSVRIHGHRWELALRGGHQFRRQLKAFKEIAEGKAIQGELALFRKRASTGDHRNGIVDRDNGGQRMATRIMCKMVAWFPREKTKKAAGILIVTRAPDALLVALNAKNNRLWTINADHVLRRMAEHRTKLQRWREDQKFERRASCQSVRDTACTKYRNRIDTACHQFSAQIVNYAKRNRFAEIRFVDTASTYAAGFPWHTLTSMLEYKANAAGILFNKENKTDEQETGQEVDA